MSTGPDMTSERNREMSEAEIAALLEQARQPGLVLVKTYRPDDPGLSGCWIGGLPTLPEDIAWPMYDAPEDVPAIPMHFLCQIDLRQIPRFDGRPGMPDGGTLFFFVDPVYAPVYGYLRGGGRVIHVPQDVSACPERAVPDGLPVDLDDDDLPTPAGAYDTNPTDRYPRWNFTFEPFEGLTMAVSENRNFRHAVSVRCSRAWDTVREKTAHLRGKLSVREDDVPAERAETFAMHSMFSGTDLPDPRELEPVVTLKGDSLDYLPLLVIDYDPDALLGLGYGDKAKFWISRDDLSHGYFDDVFMLGGQ